MRRNVKNHVATSVFSLVHVAWRNKMEGQFKNLQDDTGTTIHLYLMHMTVIWLMYSVWFFSVISKTCHSSGTVDFIIFVVGAFHSLLVENISVMIESISYFVFRSYTGAFDAFQHVRSFFHSIKQGLLRLFKVLVLKCAKSLLLIYDVKPKSINNLYCSMSSLSLT